MMMIMMLLIVIMIVIIVITIVTPIKISAANCSLNLSTVEKYFVEKSEENVHAFLMSLVD